MGRKMGLKTIFGCIKSLKRGNKMTKQCGDCIEEKRISNTEPCRYCYGSESHPEFKARESPIFSNSPAIFDIPGLEPLRAEIERLTQSLHDERSNCCTISGELSFLTHDYNAMKESKEKEIAEIRAELFASKNLIATSKQDMVAEIAFLKDIIKKLIKE
jgi:hypothetical protein